MRTLNDYFLTGKITTISTAGSSFVTAPDSGKIINLTIYIYKCSHGKHRHT